MVGETAGERHALGVATGRDHPSQGGDLFDGKLFSVNGMPRTERVLQGGSKSKDSDSPAIRSLAPRGDGDLLFAKGAVKIDEFVTAA